MRCYGLYFRELSALEAHIVVSQSDTIYSSSSDWSILGFLLKRHQCAVTCLENIGQANIKRAKIGFQLSHKKLNKIDAIDARREGLTYDGKAHKKDYLNRFRF